MAWTVLCAIHQTRDSCYSKKYPIGGHKWIPVGKCDHLVNVCGCVLVFFVNGCCCCKYCNLVRLILLIRAGAIFAIKWHNYPPFFLAPAWCYLRLYNYKTYGIVLQRRPTANKVGLLCVTQFDSYNYAGIMAKFNLKNLCDETGVFLVNHRNSRL